MTSPTKRVRRAPRRPAFSMRQLLLFFGLLAIGLCATGLALRLLARTAQQHPVPAGLAVAGLVLTAPLLWRARTRRGPGRRLPRRRVMRPGAPGPGFVDPVLPVQETREPELPYAGEPIPGAPEGAPAFVADEVPAGVVVEDVPSDVVVEETVRLGAEDYAAMDPDTFEQAVAALCARDGCGDVEVVGGAGDLGADVIATTPDGRRVVIQCKRYGPINKVGSQDVQRFGGTCFAVHEASVAAVVTTGGFTQPAAEYAEQCGILCFDHEDLVAWSDGTGPAPWEATAPSGTR
ncbi:restriction endonuclease [Streptomyces sp. NPDC008121]|uniref:restriction endonuclease n=1 Tax=Streptomyces sp. NPDC008121 TaxID=3364809 RepID=UPI0036F08F93